MTIAPYIPRWLRNRWQRPAPQQLKTVAKKDRQVLPTLPKPNCPPIPWQDDDGAARFRVYWRM
jgi:hypothetical protein